MSTKITDTEMTSDVTRHTATAWPVPGEPTLWTVTWLPGRNLTRDQAITAMTIAEVVICHLGELADTNSKWWLHIDGWAAELGISGANAMAEAALSPEDHAVPRDRWNAGEQPIGRTAQPGAYATAVLAESIAAGTPVTVTDDETDLEDAAAKLAEIRLVLAAFDWETDDRQYALEQIDDIVNGKHAAEDDDEQVELEPYCAKCGTPIGVFYGMGDGYHHYRDGENGIEIYAVDDHLPAVSWAPAGDR